MKIASTLFRSLPLVALCLATQAARAQNCTGTIGASTTEISLGAGGVQTLDLTVAPEEVGSTWQLLGALGVEQPVPFLAYGGLLLDNDRYLLQTYNGGAGFVQGGISGFLGGLIVPFDAAGNAQLSVVIPPGLPSSLIGLTLNHGMYRTHPGTLLPTCGTATVSLRLVP